MRCHICDRVLDDPKWVEEVGNYDPCDTCIAVIEDTLAGFTDKPAAEEDAFGDAYLWGLDHPAHTPLEEFV